MAVDRLEVEIVYLACPYTDPDPKIRECRFQCATTAAARLIERGLVVFSPITMTHPIDLVLAEDGQTMGSDYWVRFDEAFMAKCSRMIVLKLPGWDKSSGVRRETEWFSTHDRQIDYLEWTSIESSENHRRDVT